jgi:hypothetical protein
MTLWKEAFLRRILCYKSYTRMYEVEYLDGYKASLAANTIAENLFAQVDEEGNHYVDGSQLKENEAFIKSSNGGQRCKETTKG